jgi:hypothetical protein
MAEVWPDIADVRLGVDYGPNGDDYTGTLIVPTAAQVIIGVTCDATTAGTVTLPAVGNVLESVAYGPSLSLTGTLELISSGTISSTAERFIHDGMPGYELIVYTQTDGTSRQIAALVDRMSPEMAGIDGLGETQVMEITVENDDASGIAAKDLNCGGDTVTLAIRAEGTPEAVLVRAIVEQDDLLLTINAW